MGYSIREFANFRGISEQRARELARKGLIRAQKQAGTWTITFDESTPTEIPLRRPLSAQSQEDLLRYINTLSFDHVAGHRRSRLAQRVRELEHSSEKARTLRDYFRNSPLPAGKGAAATIRAAMLYQDTHVEGTLNLNPRVALTSTRSVASKLRNARILAGLSVTDAAASAGLRLEEYCQLERVGHIGDNNLKAIRALAAVGVRPAKITVESGSRPDLQTQLQRSQAKGSLPGGFSAITESNARIAASLMSANMSAITDAMASSSQATIKAALDTASRPAVQAALTSIQKVNNTADTLKTIQKKEDLTNG
ncbi:hypothetical protein [Leucobacter komagatae]|uniref:hypothetical protein n=1 Tax=Leucobacter komagatae TaxID=55969 RepID=UPI0012ED6392|nr:hypothetical protein [Leucobacter komagatae]